MCYLWCWNQWDTAVEAHIVALSSPLPLFLLISLWGGRSYFSTGPAEGRARTCSCLGVYEIIGAGRNEFVAIIICSVARAERGIIFFPLPRVTLIRFTWGCGAFRAYCWIPRHLQEIGFQEYSPASPKPKLPVFGSHSGAVLLLFSKTRFPQRQRHRWAGLGKWRPVCSLSCHFKNSVFVSAWIPIVVNSENRKLTHYLRFYSSFSIKWLLA